MRTSISALSCVVGLLWGGLAYADRGTVELTLDGDRRDVVAEFDASADGSHFWLDARFDDQRAVLELWDLPEKPEVGGDIAELTGSASLRLQDAEDQLELGRPGDALAGEFWLEADGVGGYTVSFDISITAKRDGRRMRLLGEGLYDAPSVPRRPGVGEPGVAVGAESGCDSGDWDAEEDESYASGGCDDVDWSSDEDDGWASDDGGGCDGDDWGSESDDSAGCDGDDWGNDDDDDDGPTLDCDGDALAAGTPRRKSRWIVRLFNWGPWFAVVLFIHGMRRRRTTC